MAKVKRMRGRIGGVGRKGGRITIGNKELFFGPTLGGAVWEHDRADWQHGLSICGGLGTSGEEPRLDAACSIVDHENVHLLLERGT